MNFSDQKKPLLILLIGLAILLFFVVKPFIAPLILAMAFAVVLHPIYRRLTRYVWSQTWLSSLLICLFVLVFILTPILFFGTVIFYQAQGLYTHFSQPQVAMPIPHWLSPYLSYVRHYFQQILAWIFQHIGGIFSGLVQIIVDVFLFIIALFFLLKEGSRLKQFALSLSPFNMKHNNRISEKLALGVRSVIQGGFVVALCQGLLAFVGFRAFGVPNPGIWAGLTAISALIPGIGTSLVLVPAVIFLFLTAHFLPGIGLLVWSVLVVGLIDNFLGPRLVGKRMNVHPFLTLLCVLGGVGLFGPIGVLVGPVLLSLLLTLVEIYLEIRNSTAR